MKSFDEHMTAIAEIREKLRHLPDAVVEETANSITVRPASSDGFSVSLTVANGQHLVSFEGWHEHFADADEAVRCFSFGLSPKCRLAITYRGDHPVQWTLESEVEGCWSPDSTTGALIAPFWRAKRTVYRTNRLLAAEEVSAQSTEKT